MSKKVGIKITRLPHGVARVHVRGRHVGFIHAHYKGFQASNLAHIRVGGHHTTMRLAAEHLARHSRPAVVHAPKMKRPRAINPFRVRKHPTASLGVHPIRKVI